MSLTRDPSKFEVPDGDDLRQLRLISGLSLTDAADELGISTESLRRWERGQFEPRLSDCEALLDIYSRSIDGQQQLPEVS